MWASLHTASAYLLCGLVVVHLAMHWAFLALAFKVPYNPSRRHAITTSVNAVAALGVLALGVTAVGKVAPSASGAAVEESTESQAWAAGPAGDITGESSTSGSSSSAASTPAAPSSGKPHGKNSSSSMSGSSSSASSSGQSATSSTSGQAQAGSASGTESSSAGSTSGSSSSASGICTLCRKQCPLSAPKCNKPYEAGLL